MMTQTAPFLFDNLLGQAIMDIFAGNIALILLFFSFFFVAFGMALRLTNEMIMISLLFFVSILTATIMIPAYIKAIIFLSLSLILILIIYSIFSR